LLFIAKNNFKRIISPIDNKNWINMFEKQHYLTVQLIRIFLVIIFSVLVSLGRVSNVVADDASLLLWSPTLLERSAEREKEFQEFNTWLSTTSGESLAVVLEPDYDKFMHRFEHDELAMIWVGPQLLQQIMKHRPDMQILAMTRDEQGKTDYRCVLFSRQEYNGDASDVLHHSVALTQPLSTCGSIGAQLLTQQFAMKQSQINGLFTGSHQNAIVSVMLGETVSGIIATSVYERFSWLPLKKLAVSSALPSFVWLVNPNLVSPQQQQHLRLALSQAGSADALTQWYSAFHYGFETDMVVISAMIEQFMKEVK
jgi:phosphonate transport system substrate-binding protein